MATQAMRAPMSAEHRFFLLGAIAMAAVNVAGFSLQFAMGRSTFAAPPLLHVHTFAFFGWTFFYVLQTALATTGAVALHRRLGWIGAGWAAAIVLLGIVMTVGMVRRGASPFFFEPVYFLFMNSLSVLCFGALATAAILLRRRTDWHRRLFFCGMTVLMGPAFGRLLPMPLLIPWAGWAVFAAIMIFPVIGVGRERARGRVHPAWWWGTGAIVATQVAMAPIAFSPLGLAVYGWVTAGTPGAAVSPVDFPPFPPGV
ncbi:hypothetical protein [Sphingomonas sanxanigenens]|uniref:Uncharacterized protein n=1 Tax=Sphingomonas sanxanigenens DSM 19645 = NX02 TaxID=1123269 RepID=W0A665_9SPHN|nr:hypothetical protein [Sphingomonas sanxanigenens]AHE52526.1 hypothetical protein NX02_03865 [Sphingomonas sanxanigenens DSM 19645 = NX02]